VLAEAADCDSGVRSEAVSATMAKNLTEIFFLINFDSLSVRCFSTLLSLPLQCEKGNESDWFRKGLNSKSS
jgi:hypothetical protein